MARKLAPQRRTNPLWWVAAAICTIITLAIIVVSIAVVVGYMVIHPRVPVISVVGARLDRFQYDLAGILVTQVNVVVRSQNDNMKAHARFRDLSLALVFEDMEIARLEAESYDVGKNSSVDFNYVAASEPVPLSPQQMQDVDVSLKRDRVRFDLRGSVRARWRVGLLGSVNFFCPLNCKLNFRASDGSYIPSRCTSKSK